ncbi:MAG: hypothetical protein PHR16_01565 [Methylovulum sp.]|nr:hypothetical protein [Methylovulum sp.]
MFILWWTVQKTLLMPALIDVENLLLGAVYKQAQVQVSLMDDHTINIATGLISQDSRNKATMKNSRFLLHTHVPVNPNMTLGLATAWGLLMAMPYRRLRNIGLATILLLPFIVVNLYVDLQHHLSTFLLSVEMRIVAVPYFGTLTTIPPPAAWVPGLTHAISILLLNITNFILPAMLVYSLNKPVIQPLKELVFPIGLKD